MQRDYQDVLWGVVLVLAGLIVAAYSARHYEFGNLRRMGPGFFPVTLGFVLAGLGAVIAVPAFNRAGEVPAFSGRELLGVMAALVLFAVLLQPAGLIIASTAAALISVAIAPRPGILWRLLLAAIVALLTWLIFVQALNMSIPVWPWSR